MGIAPRNECSCGSQQFCRADLSVGSADITPSAPPAIADARLSTADIAGPPRSRCSPATGSTSDLRLFGDFERVVHIYAQMSKTACVLPSSSSCAMTFATA
jgi:hypothetical protein